MTENPFLSEGVLSVLNIMEYHYDITPAVTPRLKTSTSTTIYLWWKDIVKSKLEIEDFENALRQIAHIEPSIKIIDFFDYREESPTLEQEATGIEPSLFEVSLPVNFKELLVRLRERYSEQKIVKEKDNSELEFPETLVVTLKDREIRVNNFLISKPHATGKNMGFFEYFYEWPNKEIDREYMPDSLKNELSGKHFTKILNALGFRGEILKTFFPKRGKNLAMFKKEVTKNALINSGINLEVLLKELQLAHTRNSLK